MHARRLLSTLGFALPAGFLAFLLAGVYPSTVDSSSPSADPPPISSLESYDEYGFDRSLFSHEDATVRRNETLSDILGRNGVTSVQIAQLAELSRSKFDVRSIRAGRPYRMYFRRDASVSPASLVYEPDATSYVVFDVSNEAAVSVWRRPVIVHQRVAHGVIESSLYETLQNQETDLDLAFELSEIFAWQIDFYRLQPGDRFTAIYDRRFVGGNPIGVGTVHGARFESGGRKFLAFHFDRQGSIAYFDEEGNSLRKSFLISPVKYSRISSRYSRRRYHPVLRRYRAHLGTDYAAPYGTPIRATGDGVVVEGSYKRGNGRYVKIRHNGTYTTAYLHMSKLHTDIKPGRYVSQGDIIGYVGSTGLARGPHVCYRFWKNGRQVDPLRETFPSAEPVSDENRPAFFARRDDLISRLDAAQPTRSLPPYALVLK